MTNGEKLKAIFPNIDTSIVGDGDVIDVYNLGMYCQTFDVEWWNAEYIEPTTKNDLPHCQHTDEEIAKSFIEDVEAVKDQLPCGEQMDFPDTFDEFAKDYGFKDKDEVYTNGSELIPVFRVKQWLEHINATTALIDESNFSQEQYTADLQSAYDCGLKCLLSQDDYCLVSVASVKRALKQEQTVDCISRESVLKLLDDYREKHSENREEYPVNYGTLLDILRWIRNLPSVTPYEPRWISTAERLPQESLNSIIGWDDYRKRCVLVQYIDGHFQITGKAESFDIKAWMPLPKSYSEVKE